MFHENNLSSVAIAVEKLKGYNLDAANQLRNFFGSALINRYAELGDVAAAVQAKRRLALPERSTLIALAVAHYKNKQDGDQLMIEDRMSELARNSDTPGNTQFWKSKINKLYLSLLSEAVKRFDTHEINRILAIYQKPSHGFSTVDMASLYRILKGDNDQFDVKNHLHVFRNFANASRSFGLIDRPDNGQMPLYETLPPVLLQIAHDVYHQNPAESDDLFGWIGSRVYLPDIAVRAKFEVKISLFDHVFYIFDKLIFSRILYVDESVTLAGDPRN